MTGPSRPFAELKGNVIIFHAGSLSVPFEAMEKEFGACRPDVNIRREASGSQAAARKISEQNKPCDIIASADFRVIDQLLIPTHASWNIRFAANQLVLCYTDKSRYSDGVNERNWHEILQRKEVVWSHTDPNLDPCGYRALMVLQLAEKFYGKPGLNEKILANRPLSAILPGAEELVSLLKSGNMDYAYEYLSVAVQHGLKYIILPDGINLGNYREDPYYSQALVKTAGEKPGEVVEMKGESITYGVTLLDDAPNRGAAIAFLAYMLKPEGGLKILKQQGQPPFVPCRIPTEKMNSLLPEELARLVNVEG